ncbi:hypothetical protein O181_003535 [Austropuccinia psidii MF-1]|uniref:Uncharacterized protein n=1 Tax=Austropuccinia psidii MF-1 TaxID=1389203 RepID=A0A9Q3BEM3_9BASI|nr:hypothetical protein [Austropuccinia psidii MF-1]
MMATRRLRFLILLVLNAWPREKISFSTSTQNLQSSTSVLLGRSHVVVLVTGSRKRDVERWTNVGGSIPVGCRPIYSSSAVPISRINTEGVVKRVRRIANSRPDLDAEGSDELDEEEVKVVNNPALLLLSLWIPSTPRNFQPTLVAIPTSFPHSSPRSSHTRPAINPEVIPSPIQQYRASPIVTSQKLQPEASSSRRREELSPLPFPATQGFQQRDCWPIQVTREDPNTASENQDSVARLFRRVDRNIREVIMYSNERTIPGTASEEMATKSAWYEDELINYFQTTFDDMVEITSFLFLVSVWFDFYTHSHNYQKINK